MGGSGLPPALLSIPQHRSKLFLIFKGSLPSVGSKTEVCFQKAFAFGYEFGHICLKLLREKMRTKLIIFFQLKFYFILNVYFFFILFVYLFILVLVLGTESKASFILGKHFHTEL